MRRGTANPPQAMADAPPAGRMSQAGACCLLTGGVCSALPMSAAARSNSKLETTFDHAVVPLWHRRRPSHRGESSGLEEARVVVRKKDQEKFQIGTLVTLVLKCLVVLQPSTDQS